jgi:hypothetical protein
MKPTELPTFKPVAYLAEEQGYLPGDGRRELWFEPRPYATSWKQTPLWGDDLRTYALDEKARADKAQANYQFMVDRVADEKLDGYRELGQRAADAENQAVILKQEITVLKAKKKA